MTLRALRGWLLRLFGLFSRQQREQEFAEELASHLHMHIEDNLRAGMSPEEARRQAHIKLGGVTQTQELYREQKGLPMLETLLHDLRFGLRMLIKRPGFTLIALLTLSLGIGANTAIFSVVNAVLLRPLPYAEAERLVWIGGWARNKDKEAGVTPADFLDYREQCQSFAQLAASISNGVPMNLSNAGDPERIKGALVTANYLDVFGVPPLLGRTFVAGEEQEGHDGVVVLSHALWQRRFGADPAILNQPITLDGRKLTVIGVMPPQFQYPAKVEAWKPFSFTEAPNSPMRSRQFHMLRPVGKLKSGVSLAQAQADVDAVAHRLEAQYPQTNTNWSLWLTPLQEQLVGNIRQTLLVLFGAVVCVLLIACANVAHLLLARATTRQKEIAVRAALGASRGRIVRQLLVESALLALLGSAGGLLLAQGSVRLLLRFGAAYIPRAAEVHLSVPVFIFALTTALLAGLLFGVVPAWQATRLELTNALKDGGKSSGGQRHRTLHALVVSEVALAVVLLVCAGLLLNSFVRLQRVRPGFDEKNLLTMRIDLPNPYAQPEQKTQFFDQLQQRVAALPGVETVGLVTELPLTPSSADMPFKIEGRAANDAAQNLQGDIRNINHAYFQAMRIPLLRGRNVTEAEVRENAKVVMISEVLAQRFFASEEPLGQRLRLELLGSEPYEIIGIVGDVRHRELASEPRPTMYFPSLRLGYANLAIRTATDPLLLTAAVRKEVMALNTRQPIADVKTMEQWVSESVAQPRFRTLLLGLFAGVALLLSVIGIYGVLSYAVTERRQELGIRLALGATARNVLQLVLRQGLTLTLCGVGIGLAAAVGVTRLLQGLLYDVGATDPLTFAAIALLLAGIALLACWIPARRATKVDPLAALRHD